MNAHSLMLEALKLAEWGGSDDDERYCPVCENRQEAGHWSGCKLAAAIREGELAEHLGLHRTDTVQAARDYMQANRDLDVHLAKCKLCSSVGGLCDEGTNISYRIDTAMVAFVEADGGGEAHDPAQ